MTKRNVIQCILSILLAAYLSVALVYSNTQNHIKPYSAINIHIDTSAATEYVTADDIILELGSLPSNINRLPADSIDISQIEDAILSMDNIEDANCYVLNNHSLRLDVVPLIPIARIFDTSTGRSFYINRQGKQMTASQRYRIDVPVVVGDFSWKASPEDAIPILDYLAANPDMGALVSAIHINKKGNIVLVPAIRGHVINFGDNSNVKNKFDRLRIFYRDVMPVKGWEYYDLLTLKWDGQIVAKRRVAELPVTNLPEQDEEELPDEGTSSTIVN